jgi:hypothetical protein
MRGKAHGNTRKVLLWALLKNGAEMKISEIFEITDRQWYTCKRYIYF